VQARLRGLATELGLDSQVSFVGSVPADDLPAYFAASDLFVHPNRIEGQDFEGFGMVFLEAAAAGRAVIGGRSGGVPEAIDEGRTGLLVDGTNVDELTEAIRRLVDNPDLRQSFGAAGRARAVDYFTWDRAARQVRDADARLRASAAG
jgi:phosphatidylinositol alpha-1,6-mannosyltransferase